MTGETTSISFQAFSLIYEILVNLGIIKEKKASPEEQRYFIQYMELKGFHFTEPKKPEVAFSAEKVSEKREGSD